MLIQKISKSYLGQHIQIAGNPLRYEILNRIRNYAVAYANNIRYSNKFHIIGQSAASLLSPL
jgi:hypothetical protein